MKICSIVAMDEDRVIGQNGALPWHVPGDLKRFRTLTTNCPVLMGRKTFDSLPQKSKPLPNRRNIVLTRANGEALRQFDVEVWTSLEDCIREYREGPKSLSADRFWVIGGSEVYWAALPFVDEIYLTKISGKHEGDAFMPPFEEKFTLQSEEPHDGYSFLLYVRT